MAASYMWNRCCIHCSVASDHTFRQRPIRGWYSGFLEI
jgi:hypothetical protein